MLRPAAALCRGSGDALQACWIVQRSQPNKLQPGRSWRTLSQLCKQTSFYVYGCPYGVLLAWSMMFAFSTDPRVGVGDAQPCDAMQQALALMHRVLLAALVHPVSMRCTVAIRYPIGLGGAAVCRCALLLLLRRRLRGCAVALLCLPLHVVGGGDVFKPAARCRGGGRGVGAGPWLLPCQAWCPAVCAPSPALTLKRRALHWHSPYPSPTPTACWTAHDPGLQLALRALPRTETARGLADRSPRPRRCAGQVAPLIIQQRVCHHVLLVVLAVRVLGPPAAKGVEAVGGEAGGGWGAGRGWVRVAGGRRAGRPVPWGF